MKIEVPVRLVPQLPHVTPDDFRAMGIDGYCSYWHYKPLAEAVCAIVHPRNVFEIGFFLGSSSYCWLSSSTARVVSCDPIVDVAHDALRPIRNSQALAAHFGQHRMTFIPKSSEFVYDDVKHIPFDLAFVDGRHDAIGVAQDIGLCAKLKIPYVLLDDFAGVVQETYFGRFLSVYEPVQGFSLENPPHTNPVDCMLCRLRETNRQIWPLNQVTLASIEEIEVDEHGQQLKAA